ncbi:MAG: hypothetical protein HC795_07835 [Coleofasciculaceae cyanobacterium RL_1_1]|nr:hypothetical protein [Coleofasciculaceae cyanobacterium RL_1_1]
MNPELWSQYKSLRKSIDGNKENLDKLISLACERDVQSDDSLPVHFFTIVLNGQPFIQYHIDVLEVLPFEWHWHIIEGVAELKGDTAWSLVSGGRVDAQSHNNGLSIDGTTDYIDRLKERFQTVSPFTASL